MKTYTRWEMDIKEEREEGGRGPYRSGKFRDEFMVKGLTGLTTEL